jgi:hypothetical protein
MRRLDFLLNRSGGCLFWTVRANGVEVLLANERGEHEEVGREMVLAGEMEFHRAAGDQVCLVTDVEIEQRRRCFRNDVQAVGDGLPRQSSARSVWQVEMAELGVSTGLFICIRGSYIEAQASAGAFCRFDQSRLV